MCTCHFASVLGKLIQLCLALPFELKRNVQQQVQTKEYLR